MSWFDPASLAANAIGWLNVLLVTSIKGAVVLGVAGVFSLVLRRGTATMRHALWCASLCGLLVLPLLSSALQTWRVPVLPSYLFTEGVGAARQEASDPVRGETTREVSVPRANVPQGEESRGAAGSLSQHAPQPSRRADFSWLTALALLWLAGALTVAARLLTGLVAFKKLSSTATELKGGRWSELLDDSARRVGLTRAVRLLRSDRHIVPMTGGLFSTVVLLPEDADRWPAERCRVIVLHELIHVKRHDFLTQMLAQVVCALHWFNPLVWYAARRLRKEQELACDEGVLLKGVCAPEYARHLLELARMMRPAARMAATVLERRSHLEERMRAILGRAPEGRRRGPMRSPLACVASICVVLTLLAASQLAQAGPSGRTEDEKNVRALASDESGVRVSARDEATAAKSADSQHIFGAQEGKDARNAAAISEAPTEPSRAPEGVAQVTTYDDATTGTQNNSGQAGQQSVAAPPPAQKSDGAIDDGRFTEEERSHLSMNGITATYVREMEGAGYAGLEAGQLIALYTNGVRAAYVEELAGAGYAGLSVKELLALKSNGITTNIIESFQAAKYANFKARNFIAFTSNGVTPDYLKSLKAQGYGGLTPKQIVDMWVAGVTPDFIRKARARAQSDLSPEQLIELSQRGDL